MKHLHTNESSISNKQWTIYIDTSCRDYFKLSPPPSPYRTNTDTSTSTHYSMYTITSPISNKPNIS